MHSSSQRYFRLCFETGPPTKAPHISAIQSNCCFCFGERLSRSIFVFTAGLSLVMSSVFCKSSRRVVLGGGSDPGPASSEGVGLPKSLPLFSFPSILAWKKSSKLSSTAMSSHFSLL